MASDEFYLKQALVLAEQAADVYEVPVGAIVVADGAVIGRGFNQPIRNCDASAHAEIMALRDAGQNSGNYRLPGATLYVTIEPCTMCFGAMIHARIGRVVYGATEPKAGVFSNSPELVNAEHFNHQISYQSGVCEDDAKALIQRFFKQQRERKKLLKKSKDEGQSES